MQLLLSLPLIGCLSTVLMNGTERSDSMIIEFKEPMHNPTCNVYAVAIDLAKKHDCPVEMVWYRILNDDFRPTPNTPTEKQTRTITKTMDADRLEDENWRRFLNRYRTD